jgi:hypothetical protein
LLNDGRDDLLAEVQAESAGLRSYVREEVQAFLDTPEFIDALPGFLRPDSASQDRIGVILQRLRNLASN